MWSAFVIIYSIVVFFDKSVLCVKQARSLSSNGQNLGSVSVNGQFFLTISVCVDKVCLNTGPLAYNCLCLTTAPQVFEPSSLVVWVGRAKDQKGQICSGGRVIFLDISATCSSSASAFLKNRRKLYKRAIDFRKFK